MTTEEKATKMKSWSRLGSISRFLQDLGWPMSDEEWAIAYDLYQEEKQRALSKAGTGR